VTATSDDHPTQSQTVVVTIGGASIVSPDNAKVVPGGTLLYHAQGAGTGAMFTWTATGGSITPGPSTTATYIAGSALGTFSVTARSVVDPTQSQTVPVIVAETKFLAGRIRFSIPYSPPFNSRGLTFEADVVLFLSPFPEIQVASVSGTVLRTNENGTCLVGVLRGGSYVFTQTSPFGFLSLGGPPPSKTDPDICSVLDGPGETGGLRGVHIFSGDRLVAIEFALSGGNPVVTTVTGRLVPFFQD
jgi:hypothetical protein